MQTEVFIFTVFIQRFFNEMAMVVNIHFK